MEKECRTRKRSWQLDVSGPSLMGDCIHAGGGPTTTMSAHQDRADKKGYDVMLDQISVHRDLYLDERVCVKSIRTVVYIKM